MEERKAFEAWMAKDYLRYDCTKETVNMQRLWALWMAATLAERERAAKVCERERMVRGGEVFAADIRKGI